jgi:hypothetical protein
LIDALEGGGVDIIIEYIEPVERVRVYCIPVTGETHPVWAGE